MADIVVIKVELVTGTAVLVALVLSVAAIDMFVEVLAIDGRRGVLMSMADAVVINLGFDAIELYSIYVLSGVSVGMLMDGVLAPTDIDAFVEMKVANVFTGAETMEFAKPAPSKAFGC